MAFDWKGMLSKVAPMAATAIGGPFGGMAASALLNALDIKPEQGNEESQLEAAMQSMTPAQAIQLKEGERQWTLHMREMDIKEQDLHAQDRDSARNMQVQTGSWVVPVLAIVTVGGFFAVVGFILTGQVPLDSTLTGFVLGAVSSKAEQIYNFFFGSSKGSKDKTAHMAAMK